MRTLVIIRHARAASSGPSDHDRELTDRGHADAAEAGSWLAAHGVEPGIALISDATRTQQTWEEIALAAGWEQDLAEPDDAMYIASTESALDLVRTVEDGIDSVIVVGHNPTMASLVQLLDDGHGDDETGNQVALGYPTCACAVFTFDGSWEDLEEGAATLTAFHVGGQPD